MWAVAAAAHRSGARLNVWKHTFPVDLHAVLALEPHIISGMGKLPAECLRHAEEM
jgi:hypothetical protein